MEDAGSVITGDNLGRPIARNLALVFSGRAVTLALQLVAFAVTASYLEPALLGIYTFAIAFAAVFRALPTFSFDPVVTRDLAQRPDDESVLVPNVAYVRLVLAALAYAALAATLALGGYGETRTEAALIAAVVLPAIALDTFRNSFGVRLRLGWASLADVLEGVLTLVGVLVLADTGAGVYAFLSLYVAAKAFNGLILLVGATRLADFSWRPRAHSWAGLVRAAAPLALTTVLISLYFRIDMVILARLKEAADVGQYGAAYKFFETLLLVPALVTGVFQPVIARSAIGDAETLRRRFGRGVQLMAVAGLGIAVLGAMTASRALPALPGFERYGGAGDALAVLAVAAGLVFVGTMVQTTLIATHRQRQLLYVAAVALAVNVVLNATLIPPFSYMGAAAATVATEVVVVCLSLLAVRSLGLGWPANDLARAVGAAAVLGVALALTYALPPLVQVAVGVVVYVIALLATGAIARSDVTLLFRRS